MNRIQVRNYTYNSEHQDASGISVSVVYFLKYIYIKNRWLFGIWEFYFNLYFYDKQTYSQSSTFLQTTLIFGWISFLHSTSFKVLLCIPQRLFSQALIISKEW